MSDQMDDENGEGDLTLFSNQMGQPKDNHVMLISASSLTPQKSMACSLVFATDVTRQQHGLDLSVDLLGLLGPTICLDCFDPLELQFGTQALFCPDQPLALKVL
ncbi:hypothetical protein L3X38_008062 [Prunus dulcis]|uniref:Uncharacterized protein n=1 Tax=Prunus dulcis TaxID=3755 RepID=A0AAD4ZVX1_PRUDU|nr:hypothetical protein L3X38_008062 [Prunus dulcis]